MKKIIIIFVSLFVIQISHAQEDEINTMSYFYKLYNKVDNLLGENTSVHFSKEQPICNKPEGNTPCTSCLDKSIIPFVLEKLPKKDGFIIHFVSPRNSNQIESFEFYCTDTIVYVESYFSLGQCFFGVLSRDIISTREFQKKYQVYGEPVKISFFDILTFKKMFEPLLDKALEMDADMVPICQGELH